MELLFEWNAKKAKANFKKHNVSFEEAKTIFNDPLLVTFPDDEHSDEEERFISLGLSAINRVLLAVHTEHEVTEDLLIIRLISCRKATAAERSVYEEGEG